MNWIVMLLTGLSALFGCYYAAIAVVGLIHGRPEKKEDAPHYKIAAVIAARNEESVIAQAVESILRQHYPAQLTGVFVAVNNCTDHTQAVAEKAGAQVIVCEGPIHSKGDALRFAFSKLLSTDYDAYVILDADNIADPEFFAQANSALLSGYRIAQGYRDSKNPGDGWIAGCTSIFYWFMSSLYNRARSALGMSCALNGTGFMLSADLIRATGWRTATLTEDLEFSAQCALRGVKIGWMEYARVYDDQPLSLKDSMTQRRRWFAGSLQCFARYFPRLLKKKTRQSLDMAILFFGSMLQWIGLIPLILTGILAVRDGGWWAALYLLSFGAVNAALWLDLAGWYICFLEHKKFPGRGKSILLFCIYLLTWMAANLSVFFTGIPKWRMIPHRPSHDPQSLKSDP